MVLPLVEFLIIIRTIQVTDDHFLYFRYRYQYCY